MPSKSTPAHVRAAPGPADGARARYGVQGTNCRFASSSVQTGTHASVGRIGGEKDVETTDRQATGASDEATVVCQSYHLSGGRFDSAARLEGLRPVRMMRTLSPNTPSA
jgi:hypothetical protein